MREILFRGKRIDNGEWVYGYYARKGTDEEFFRHFICVNTFSSDYRSNYTYPFYLNDYEVDPSSVSEFTGLTDKNGQKIFEGDIIFDPELKDNYFVEFDEGGFCAGDMFLQAYISFGEFSCEVIGNIHDNPGLLEDKP